MEYIELNNGLEIPVLGIGTFMLYPDEAESSVYWALNFGYRLIDTANVYANERSVGRGIKKTYIDRDDVFISTKLWPTEYENNNAIDETLERLGVEYIDLLFLHQPCGNYIEGYKKLEKAYKDGKIKSIGLSNFEGKHLKEILDNCEIMPQVVQVETHPYYQELELRNQLKENNIKIMSWYPLGHGDSHLIEEPIIKKLGEKYNKTPYQIILRWHIDMGYIVIPGSKNPEHIKENLNIFDFKLTNEDMKKISSLNKYVRYYNGTEEELKQYAESRPDYESDI